LYYLLLLAFYILFANVREETDVEGNTAQRIENKKVAEVMTCRKNGKNTWPKHLIH
jgi:hypothetical protein